MTYRNLPDIFPSEQRECCKCGCPLYDGIDPDYRVGDDDYCDFHAEPWLKDIATELCGAPWAIAECWREAVRGEP